jgi:hypothetical protein
MTHVDLDDTSNCEPGRRCECCGTTGDITVVTAALGRLGVACLSMCPGCADSTVAPPVAVATAVRLVSQHCVHLGIDLDEMAEVLAGGGRR